MSKHLTLSDRAIIEKCLALDVSFAYIARHLNRSATTISREVKNHRCFVNGEEKTCRRNHAYYTAHRAPAEYIKELSTSRKGIRTNTERLMEIIDILAPRSH